MYNNHQHSTTKILPFYANYGKHPNWDPNNNITTSTSESATTKISKIVKLYGELSRRVNQGGKDTAEQVNKKRLKGPTFEKGDKIYLLTKNLKFKPPSSKLDHVRIGPFEVEKKTSFSQLSTEATSKSSNTSKLPRIITGTSTQECPHLNRMKHRGRKRIQR